MGKRKASPPIHHPSDRFPCASPKRRGAWVRGQGLGKEGNTQPDFQEGSGVSQGKRAFPALKGVAEALLSAPGFIRGEGRKILCLGTRRPGQIPRFGPWGIP